MISLQSSLTGVGAQLFDNQRPSVGLSSPGGEETGEGDLNHGGRQSALIKGWTSSGNWGPFKPAETHSSLFKAIQLHSRIFGKKECLFFMDARPLGALATFPQMYRKKPFLPNEPKL
jgi:hypothetical protein